MRMEQINAVSLFLEREKSFLRRIIFARTIDKRVFAKKMTIFGCPNGLFILACMISVAMTWQDGISSMKNGFVVHDGLWSTTDPEVRRYNYTLYVPNLSYKKTVPLMIFLHDIWSTAQDDSDLLTVMDEYAAHERGNRAFALLKPDGNWFNYGLDKTEKPWQTPEFSTMWADSARHGTIRQMIMEIAKVVKMRYNLRGPFSIVGHGVGGWGARAIADSRRGEFKAVGSLSGVTDVGCFASMLARLYNSSPGPHSQCGGRLCLERDLLTKADMALLPDDARDSLLRFDDASGLYEPDAAVVDRLKRKDPSEITNTFMGYVTRPERPRYLLYLDVGRYDEYGLYDCNAKLHDDFVARGLSHVFKVYYTGIECAMCSVSEGTDRCEAHESVKACGTHRADGPVFVEASISAVTDPQRSPIWTGSIKSRFVEFVFAAAEVVYG